VLTLVRTLAGQGVPVIIISHNMQDVFAVADRIVIMRRGKKVADGSPVRPPRMKSSA